MRLLKRFFNLLCLLAIPHTFPLSGTHPFYSPKIEKEDPRSIIGFLINKNGQITPSFQQLLSLTKIDCDNLKSCVKITQQEWIAVLQGKNGIERRDLDDTPNYQAINKQVLDIIEQMGLLNPQPALKKHYDYAICLGAFMDSTRARLSALIEAWNYGVRFDQLIFLGSDRPLRNFTGQIEDHNNLTTPSASPFKIRPDWKFNPESPFNTEHDMQVLIWEQADVPKEMREHLKDKVYFINTPTQVGQQRPSTYDTYEYWVQTYRPKAGTILAASGPIIWCHQHLVGKYALGEAYELETFAPFIVDKEKLLVIIILDTLAKCLYTEYQHSRYIEGESTAGF